MSAIQPADRPPGSSPGAAGAGVRPPLQPLHHLDALWLQVAGTLCNLACTHCFVSCGPGQRRHRMMTRDEVRAQVVEALALGVREVYFTGGEPFLHRDLEAMLADTLPLAPCTVLTNGTLFTRARIAALARLSDATRHSLELRVSLDAPEPAAHDALRGPGAFARTLEGLRALERAGLLPIVTFTYRHDQDPGATRERCVLALRALGLARPRVKLLPMFHLGRERTRSGGDAATLAGLAAFDPSRLPCGSCRAVTSNGVYVCPLLVDEPEGRMGDTLAQALGPFELAHAACATCWVTGATCGNG